MSIPADFFSSFGDAVKEEISRLQEARVLDKERANKGRAYALNCVLQEHTLRYFALRNFYEHGDVSQIKFHLECPCSGGPLDVVLVDGDEQLAFEIKRWQGWDHTRQIRDRDYNNLISFTGESKPPTWVLADIHGQRG
jgi:hypothetical protein